MEILKYTKHSLEETHRTGIYYILNTLNGKFYIGSTSGVGRFPSSSGFRHRWGCHIRDLKANSHESGHLQNAWSKYGADAFDFRIAEFVEPERCIEVEQLYLDLFPKGDRKDVYNICFIAGSSLGCQRSEETRKKIGDAHRGRKASSETRLKMSEAAKGIGAKEFYLVSPEGLEVKGKNLKEFAESIGLHRANLHKVITGAISNYYGWTSNLENYIKYKEAYELRGLGWHKCSRKFTVSHNVNNIQIVERFSLFKDALDLRNKLEEKGYVFQIRYRSKNTNTEILKKAIKDAGSTEIFA